MVSAPVDRLELLAETRRGGLQRELLVEARCQASPPAGFLLVLLVGGHDVLLGGGGTSGAVEAERRGRPRDRRCRRTRHRRRHRCRRPRGLAPTSGSRPPGAAVRRTWSQQARALHGRRRTPSRRSHRRAAGRRGTGAVPGPRPSPWRRAAARAPGATAAPGWVPPDVTGMGLASRQSAAASCERAEFAVHTNTTRSAAAPAVDDAAGADRPTCRGAPGGTCGACPRASGAGTRCRRPPGPSGGGPAGSRATRARRAALQETRRRRRAGRRCAGGPAQPRPTSPPPARRSPSPNHSLNNY